MSAPSPVVSVHGTAERSASPDSFVLQLAIEARGPDPSRVNTDLAERYAVLDEALTALGEADVSLARGTVSVQRQFKDTVLEWVAFRSLRLTVSDVTRVRDVMDAVGSVVALVDGVTITGPHWQLDEDNPVHAQVQAEAVHEARARASRYADAVGGSLGRLLEIADPQGHPITPLGFAAAAPFAADRGLATMDYTPEPVTVTAAVQARWLIELP